MKNICKFYDEKCLYIDNVDSNIISASFSNVNFNILNDIILFQHINIQNINPGLIDINTYVEPYWHFLTFEIVLNTIWNIRKCRPTILSQGSSHCWLNCDRATKITSPGLVDSWAGLVYSIYTNPPGASWFMGWASVFYILSTARHIQSGTAIPFKNVPQKQGSEKPVSYSVERPPFLA